MQQETYGDIHFTPEGRKLAVQVYQSHTTIRSFLEDVLGVAPDTAEEEACHIEHVISEDTYQKKKNFKRYLFFLKMRFFLLHIFIKRNKIV